MYYQLSLFPESKEDMLEREVLRLKEQCDKVRKKQFAEISKIMKMYTELHHEMETLKISICKKSI